MKKATGYPPSPVTAPEPLDAGLLTTSKEALALNAMSSLAEEFASRPDFDRLVELMLLTVSGQFAVTNAFVHVRLGHDTRQDGGAYVGCGKFRHDRELNGLIRTEAAEALLDNDVILLADIPDGQGEGSLLARLRERKVRVLVPLRIQQRVIGLIGLGDKVTHKPYIEAEIDLLLWLMRCVTPLLVNARLFAEIDSLKSWYADLLNNIQQSVFVFDGRFRLKMMNLAALRLLENVRHCPVTTDDRRVLTMEEIFSAREFPHWVERLRNLPGGHGGALSQPLIAVTPEREHVFNARVAFSAGSGTDDADIILSLDDVTEQKDTESRLFNLEQLAEKGMMASSISHELNNFLGMILGGVEMSQLSFCHSQTQKAEDYLDKVKENILKMQRFTAALTDQHRLDPKPQLAQLNDVVTDVLSFVQVHKRFRNLNLSRHLAPDLPMFEMDADQVAQLLLNLVNNAADAIRESERPDGYITVFTAVESGNVVLTVADNGMGIPPEIQPRLFNEHLTTKEGGHGYGLVTCSKILKNHGATVEINSEEGAGSSFVISFRTESFDTDSHNVHL